MPQTHRVALTDRRGRLGVRAAAGRGDQADEEDPAYSGRFVVEEPRRRSGHRRHPPVSLEAVDKVVTIGRCNSHRRTTSLRPTAGRRSTGHDRTGDSAVAARPGTCAGRSQRSQAGADSWPQKRGRPAHGADSVLSGRVVGPSCCSKRVAQGAQSSSSGASTSDSNAAGFRRAASRASAIRRSMGATACSRGAGHRADDGGTCRPGNHRDTPSDYGRMTDDVDRRARSVGNSVLGGAMPAGLLARR